MRDGSLIVSPATMKVPRPRWCMVCGAVTAGSIHALTTSGAKKLYWLTSRVSATLHSRLAKHSSINSALTREAATGVRSKCQNLPHIRLLKPGLEFVHQLRAGLHCAGPGFDAPVQIVAIALEIRAIR